MAKLVTLSIVLVISAPLSLIVHAVLKIRGNSMVPISGATVGGARQNQQGSDRTVSTESSNSYFATLPNEVLVKILGFTPLKERQNVSSVCKRWYEISRYKEVYENQVLDLAPLFPQVPQAPRSPLLYRDFLNVIKKATTLDWSRCNTYTSALVGRFLRMSIVCLYTLTEHTNWVWNMTQLNNGQLASCSLDKTIKIWRLNAETGRWEYLYTLTGHRGGVWNMTQLNNGQLELASCSDDKTIKIWGLNAETGLWECIDTLTEHAAAVMNVTELNNGQLASCSVDKTIKIWGYRVVPTETSAGK